MAKNRQRDEGNTAVIEQPGVTERPERPFDQAQQPGVTTEAPVIAEAPPETSSAGDATSDPRGAKVNKPHEWTGMRAFYWRETNQTTHEISAMPATLVAPNRAGDAWTIVFFTPLGGQQCRREVKFSESPQAGRLTWPAKQ